MLKPVNSTNLKCTSKYGNRSFTLNGKPYSDFHRGIDLISKNETNPDILAVADGTVVGVQKTGVQYGTGCYVRIKHTGGWQTLYFHMKTKSIPVSVGDKVKKGQKIGVMGTTGQSTGAHLHFQIDKGSSATSINPYDYVFGTKELFTTTNKVTYYKKYTGKSTSLVDALKSLKIDSSFSNRGKIAKKNGISAYIGSASQNTKLLNLLKQGKLVK